MGRGLSLLINRPRLSRAEEINRSGVQDLLSWWEGNRTGGEYGAAALVGQRCATTQIYGDLP